MNTALFSDTSFHAFLQYVAAYADMEKYDYHWQTMAYQCLPCQIKYDVVTMQETSASDAVMIVQRNQVQNL